jgi:hypothetical protein
LGARYADDFARGCYLNETSRRCGNILRMMGSQASPGSPSLT